MSISGSRYVAEDVARSVVVTSAGDVLLAGQLDCAVKLVALGHGAGTRLWERAVGGAVCTSPDDGPGPPKLALDAQANVVYAGGPGVGKLDASGNVLWAQTLELGEFALIRALAIDASGDVVVAGYVDTTDDVRGAFDFLVMKLDGATGAERWHVVLTGTASPCATRMRQPRPGAGCAPPWSPTATTRR